MGGRLLATSQPTPKYHYMKEFTSHFIDEHKAEGNQFSDFCLARSRINQVFWCSGKSSIDSYKCWIFI